jgi:hypothetical protein
MSRSSLLFTDGEFGTTADCVSIEQQVLDALADYDAATAADVVCGDGKIDFTYTLTVLGTVTPIPGASIRITTDITMLNTIWTGTTNVLGIARNLCGDLPRLTPGTYYFVREHDDFVFANPDTEIVS